jgi:CBS domain-containing protein
MNASDLMSPQVVVAKENTNAEGISSRLIAGEFNGVPVVDDSGAVVGIVTAIDILKLYVIMAIGSSPQIHQW